MSWKNHEAWQACFATLSWLRWQWSPVARTKAVIERQQTKLGHGSWKLMMKSTAKWQNLGQRSNKFAWLPWKHEETTHFNIVSSYSITDWRLMVHDESRSIRCPFSTHLPFWLVLGYLGEEHPKGKTPMQKAENHVSANRLKGEKDDICKTHRMIIRNHFSKANIGCINAFCIILHTLDQRMSLFLPYLQYKIS